MDNDQVRTVLQNMASLLFKVSEATALLLEQNVQTLARQAVQEQRGNAAEIRRAIESLRGMLGSLDPIHKS